MTDPKPIDDGEIARLLCAEIFKMFTDKNVPDWQGATALTLCTAYMCESDDMWEYFKRQVTFARMAIHTKVDGHA